MLDKRARQGRMLGMDACAAVLQREILDRVERSTEKRAQRKLVRRSREREA